MTLCNVSMINADNVLVPNIRILIVHNMEIQVRTTCNLLSNDVYMLIWFQLLSIMNFKMPFGIQDFSWSVLNILPVMSNGNLESSKKL